MRKITGKVKPGAKFGDITIIKEVGYHTEPSGHNVRTFLVRCSCGKEYTTIGIYLTREPHPRCKTCSNAARRLAQVGDRFGKLTVTGFKDMGNRQLAICKCDCGNTKLVRTANLPKNKRNTCGKCERPNHWKGVGELSATYYYRTRRNARLRNMAFEVSIEYLWNLYKEQEGKCALTGLPIPFGKYTKEKNEASLDRVDSSKGYIEGNVQWVHKDINHMKWDLTPERFIQLCKLVVEKGRKDKQ